MPRDTTTFDTSAAITRSLLGWGVVAGPFYLVVALVLALTRPGFDLSRHALSLLMLGETGWLQRVNLILTALMVLVAAFGIKRAVRNGRGLAMAVLTAVYGVCLVLSAIAAPDPAGGFPADAEQGDVSVSGILHLLFGAIGFVALAAAAFAYFRWASGCGDRGHAVLGLVCGIVILLGFAGGAVLAQSSFGVALLWLAVLAGWLWLALACAKLYTVVPHPVVAQRASASTE